MPQNDALAALLKQAAQITGNDPSSLFKNAQEGRLGGLTDKMKPQDAQRFQALLNDKTQIEQLLRTPQAKALLNMLQGGRKNGGTG